MPSRHEQIGALSASDQRVLSRSFAPRASRAPPPRLLRASVALSVWGSHTLPLFLSAVNDQGYSQYNRPNGFNRGVSPLEQKTDVFSSQLRLVSMLHQGFLDLYQPQTQRKPALMQAQEEIIAQILTTRIAQPYDVEAKIAPTLMDGDAEIHSAKTMTEGSMVVALPLLLSLMIPSLISRAVAEKSEGMRMVIDCAGGKSRWVVFSLLFTSLVVNLLTCGATVVAAKQINVRFLADVGGSIVAAGLVAWSVASASIVVLGSSLFGNRGAATVGGYSFSVLGSLASTLVSSVMFGLAAELVLGAKVSSRLRPRTPRRDERATCRHASKLYAYSAFQSTHSVGSFSSLLAVNKCANSIR